MVHSRLLSYSAYGSSEGENDLDSPFYKLVNYQYFKQTEFTDYSRFLLDLKFKKIRGKELFLPLEFKQYKKTDNMALIKRDTFLELPYNRKLIDNYLIRAYAIALLELNVNPIEVRKKDIAFTSVKNRESIYNKTITRNKVIGTTYLPSAALKLFPYMELYRVRVVNFLKKYVKKSHGLMNEYDIKNGIDFKDTRYEIIEELFQSIPLYNSDEKSQLLDLVADFIKFYYNSRTFKYADRSKNRSQKYKQDKQEFKGTYMNFLKLLENPGFSSSETNVILSYFNLKEIYIRNIYDYNESDKKETVYKRFKRDIKRLLINEKISKNDINYLSRAHRLSFDKRDFKLL